MKYLFLSSDTYPPFRVDVSVLFAQKLKKLGHVIHFLIQSENDCIQSYSTCWRGNQVWVGKTDAGVAVTSIIKKYLYRFFHDFKMFDLMNSNNYDFIIIKDKFLTALVAVCFGKFFNKKIIYWLSYPFPEANIYKSKLGSQKYRKIYLLRGQFFKFLLYRMILPSSMHCFVQSNQMRLDIQTHGFSKDFFTIVPMGVDLSEFDNLELKNPYKDTIKKKVVYLGTLIKLRKIEFVLYAFTFVLKDEPSAKLFLVGNSDDPSDLDNLKDIAVKLGINRSVVFTGFLPREKALEYVYFSDVCVSPFYPTPILQSTSPTKLIEYFALRKPVVANSHPEQEIIILKSKSGLSVPYDSKAFGSAILSLLKNSIMSTLMGENGRKYVENYRTYDIIAKAVDIKMKRLLETRSTI